MLETPRRHSLLQVCACLTILLRTLKLARSVLQGRGAAGGWCTRAGARRGIRSGLVYTCGSAQRETATETPPVGCVAPGIDSQESVSFTRQAQFDRTRLLIAIDSARRVRHHSNPNRAKLSSSEQTRGVATF